MEREEEFVIYTFNEEPGCKRPSGREVGRVIVPTRKWGPSNAIEKFVREHRPPAGKYLVAGSQETIVHNIAGNPRVGPGRFNVYTVAYPDYTIEGTRSGGWQLYGEREP